MKHLLSFFCISIPAFLLNAQVTVQSTIPATLGINTEIRFDVKINKGNVANFSKYQLDVPTGVTITEVDSKGGNFSFENNRAKIIWITTPTEPEFTVTMKLNSGPGENAGVVTQKFYYLENGVKKEAEAEPVTLVFSKSGTVQAPKLSEPVVSSPAVVAKEKVAETPKPIIKEPVVAAPKAAVVEPTVVPEKKAPETPAADATTYKVQLASSAVKPDAAKYASVKQVNIAKEGTMYKVLVGNFASKEDAMKMRTELEAKGFAGFVVAYQNGARVK